MSMGRFLWAEPITNVVMKTHCKNIILSLLATSIWESQNIVCKQFSVNLKL